ncbi:DUF4145 domain-containing protein [Priestia megaterium]|uniref:DUF4145 domain-containing protein n=1 Tax=Priestia megaterium TaxID=1404 RepID=UPI00159C7591|nr:DUF4145 domain-containing protein [Priestia megaterium]
MTHVYYPPAYEENKFNCPYCNVYSVQNWRNAQQSDFRGHTVIANLAISICEHCNQTAIWHEKNLMVPESSIAPLPHEDLPEKEKIDYLEARLIVNKSPRGAAALLRLCLQKLLKSLGEKGKNINDDIASMVAKGLPIEVQQALDTLRVVGNDAVHPGELDIRDDQETAIHLFELINFLVQERITRPKIINNFYQKLPQAKRDGIEKRDAIKG